MAGAGTSRTDNTTPSGPPGQQCPAAAAAGNSSPAAPAASAAAAQKAGFPQRLHHAAPGALAGHTGQGVGWQPQPEQQQEPQQLQQPRPAVPAGPERRSFLNQEFMRCTHVLRGGGSSNSNSSGMEID